MILLPMVKVLEHTRQHVRWDPRVKDRFNLNEFSYRGLFQEFVGLVNSQQLEEIVPSMIRYLYYSQKQPLEVFCKNGVLRSFTKFTGKHLCQSLFLMKLHLSLRRRCFPVNFVEFLRTHFFTEHLRTAAFVQYLMFTNSF